jgi:hypothetical protein
VIEIGASWERREIEFSAVIIQYKELFVKSIQRMSFRLKSGHGMRFALQQLDVHLRTSI